MSLKCEANPPERKGSESPTNDKERISLEIVRNDGQEELGRISEKERNNHSNEALTKSILYGINETPPWHICFILGFQVCNNFATLKASSLSSRNAARNRTRIIVEIFLTSQFAYN